MGRRGAGYSKTHLKDPGDELPWKARNRIDPEPLLEVALPDHVPIGDELVVMVIEGGTEDETDVHPEAEVDKVGDRVNDDPWHAVQVREECHTQWHPECRVLQIVLEHELKAKVALAVLRRRNEPVVAPEASLDDCLGALAL